MDWNEYCAEEERDLRKHFHKCLICSEYITDEYRIRIGTDFYHEDCFNDRHREYNEREE